MLGTNQLQLSANPTSPKPWLDFWESWHWLWSQYFLTKHDNHALPTSHQPAHQDQEEHLRIQRFLILTMATIKDLTADLQGTGHVLAESQMMQQRILLYFQRQAAWNLMEQSIPPQGRHPRKLRSQWRQKPKQCDHMVWHHQWACPRCLFINPPVSYPKPGTTHQCPLPCMRVFCQENH